MGTTASARHRFIDRRVTAVGTTVLLLIGILGGVASAVTVPSGTLGGFENDGNLVVDAPGNKDWENVSPTVIIDDTLDSGFQGSSKEEQPADWTCDLGGASPGKSNILRSYVSTRISQSEAWLDLAFVRQDGTGDAHVNFEFNRNPAPPGDCAIDRRPGDFLVTYDFPGGSNPADIRTWSWSGSSWTELAITADDARAASNSGTVSDPIAGGTIGPRQFGETTLNLLANALPDMLGCPGFGYVNIRSRSSHSITSALQDRLPTTALNLSTCGKIIVNKVDDHLPPQALAGALFGLFPNADASGTPLHQAAGGADGKATFDNVTPGTYWVKEISAPAGYGVDPAIVGPITVGFRQTVEVTEPFVDPRDTGTIRIVKQLHDENGNPVTPSDPASLDGASFLVFKDGNGNRTYQAGEEAKLWPDEATNATCTISGGTGFCDVGPLPTGTYGVHETVAPPGTSPSGDVHPVVLSTAGQVVQVPYVNSLSPLNMSIDKSGPNYAHVGDTITYNFAVSTSGPRLHDVTVEEVGVDRCDTPMSGPVKSGGDQDGFLEPGETWTYSCDHVVAASPDPLPNEARATGTDDFGRTVTATDTHAVDVLKPAITLDKKVAAGDHKPAGNALMAHAGDTLPYSIAIQNTGDAPLEITALTDTLKDSLPASCSAGVGSTLAVGATITCSYTLTAGSDDHTNEASVTAMDAIGGPKGTVSATDATFVNVINPAIQIVKSGTDVAHEGDPVSYTFAVTNMGDVPLTNVNVVDDILGNIGAIASLAVGETQTLSRSSVAPSDDVTNVGTACGLDPLGLEVCDDDDHELDVIHPGVQIVKSGASQAEEGDDVTYTFEVTNTGGVVLTGVSVDDDVLGPIGAIASLAVGEAVTLDKTVAAPASAVRNVAEACGFDPLGLEVCDDDDHVLDIVNPTIQITKTGPDMAHEGDDILYTFDVTNTGDVPLVLLAVIDDVLGDIGTIPSLAVGATTQLTRSFTVPANTDEVVNTVEACGIGPVAARQYCDSDIHVLSVIHPEVTLDKQVNGADHASADDALLVHADDVVQYTVVITNTGDTPLEIVELTDTDADVSEVCSGGVGDVLDAGSIVTCTYTQVISEDANSVAAVTAVDALGGDKGTVAAFDETFVAPIAPAIEVVKTAAPMSLVPGETVTYSYLVTNIGDTDLFGLTVTDDILGAIGTVDSLAVGESVTLTRAVVVDADSPRTNVGTACGTDVLDLEVCDDDTETISIVLPDPPERRTPPAPIPGLPRTGLEILGWIALSTTLISSGMAMMNTRRRRRLT